MNASFLEENRKTKKNNFKQWFFQCLLNVFYTYFLMQVCFKHDNPGSN